MILQALKEYYDRKPDLPHEGWETKTFPYLIRIKENGDFFDFYDTREGEGKARREKEFLVPALGEKKGNGIKANLFWENLEYLLGYPIPTEKKPNPDKERVQVQHEAFKQRIATIPGECDTLKIVRLFLSNINHTKIQQDPNWPNVLKLNRALLLAIVNRGPVTDDHDLRKLIDASRPRCGTKNRCLVTGEQDEIVALEPPIRGVREANPTGASLVAINNKVSKGVNAGQVPAFASFMKEQGHNSPIGKTASFAYTTALNHLLRRDSPQRLQIGDATMVFWSEAKTEFEAEAALFFSEPFKDDPDKYTDAVKSLYASIWNGAYVAPCENTRFYVLGLAPNSARIAVRFWEVNTVQQIGKRLLQHVADLSIDHGKLDPALPLRKLLRTISAQEEEKNIPPNLAGETMRAILEGLPYPQTLLQAAIRRVRAEQAKKDKRKGKSLPNVSYERAALIKACLNRLTRRSNPQQQEEMKVSLDTINTNIGYRLGRLFASLEKIQAEASPGINATIRDKFYGAASSTPVTVFGNLMRLKNHHLAKLEHAGRRVNLERLLGEIMGGINDFPPHLKLEDQGRFAIGYYHQMQDFYTKKEKQD